MTRDAARQGVFDYIEMLYNPKRKHTNDGMLSPVDLEYRQQKLNEAGVQKTRRTSFSVLLQRLWPMASTRARQLAEQ